MSKNDLPEINAKITKDQILAAYNDALTKLNAKERLTPDRLVVISGIISRSSTLAAATS